MYIIFKIENSKKIYYVDTLIRNTRNRYYWYLTAYLHKNWECVLIIQYTYSVKQFVKPIITTYVC